MIIVGSDFHPAWQQIAVVDSESGEINEHKLVNGNGEAERFYRRLPVPSLIGIEACGNSQWLIELLQKLGHECGSGMQLRSVLAMFASRRRTDATPLTFSSF